MQQKVCEITELTFLHNSFLVKVGIDISCVSTEASQSLLGDIR